MRQVITTHCHRNPLSSQPTDSNATPMENSKLPRWSGPLIGMIIGGWCGLKGAWVNPQIPVLLFAMGGALIGGIAGGLVILLDPKPPGDPSTESNPYRSSGSSDHRSGVIGRFLAVSGLLLCWTPFLGLALNLVGLAVNWSSKDWAQVLSKIGLIVGIIVTLWVGIGLIVAG